MGAAATLSLDSEHDREQSVAKISAQLTDIYPETTTIEIAARRLGIGRSLAFQLAREERFPVPVIRAGRRLLVPIAALERVLAGEPIDSRVA